MKGKLTRFKITFFAVYLIILLTSSFTWTLVKVNATLPPIPISPSDGAIINDSTPTFQWSLVPSAVDYEIQVSTEPDFDPLSIDDSAPGNSYTPVSGLSDGLYYWHVRAYDPGDGGYSAWTPTFDFTIDTVAPSIPIPNSPGNGEYINDDTPYIDWSTVSGAALYQIRIDDDSDMSSPYINETTATSDYTSATLPQGTWYWDVRAQDLAGNWGFRSAVYQFIIDTNPPAAATLISPENDYTGNSIVLQCSTASGANYYNFRIATDHLFTNTVTLVQLTTTQYTVSGLADGSYYWRVITEDYAGNVVFSAIRYFTLDTQAPLVPTLVSPDEGESVSDTTPYLDWFTSAGGTVEYQVQVDTSLAFSSLVVNDTTASTDYTTPTLSEDTYFWRVRARDAYENWSGWSIVRNFTIDITPPEAPTLNTPQDDAILNNNLPLLTWFTVSEPALYVLQIDTEGTFTSPIVSQAGIMDTFYQIISILSDNEYFWRVYALDAAGNIGSWSSIRSFTVDTLGPNAPVLSSPGDSDAIIDTTPMILWTAVGDAEEYQLQIDTAGTFSLLEYNITTLDNFYSIISPLGGGMYFWRVRAKDQAGNWGSWSDVWSFTIDLVGPDAPTITEPIDDSVIDDKTPYISWTLIGDAVEYELELATEATFGASLVYTTTTVNNYFTIFFELADDVYYLRVRAKDALDNWGDWSIVSEFAIDTVAIPEFNNLALIIPIISIVGLVVQVYLKRKRN